VQLVYNGAAIMDEIQQRLQTELHRMGDLVVQIAESLAPRETGRLATSIAAVYDDADLSVTFTADTSYRNYGSYAMFVEYGTRYQAPHPYLRPAINHVFSQTFGFNTSMDFQNLPAIAHPLLANAGGFDLPRFVLTKRQKQHINQHLLPTSKRYYTGAVSRTRVHASRAEPAGFGLPGHYRRKRF
jgi:HK97 gp10 family phage protein